MAAIACNKEALEKDRHVDRGQRKSINIQYN